MPYVLGPVKPWVKSAADIVGGQFGISTIYGVASRSYASDHPLGLALDFMVYGDKSKGDAVAQYCVANAAKLNVHYVIWYQHIWNRERASEGWREMENRGSATANHMDHVHVSFNSTATNTAPAGDIHIPGVPDWMSGLIPDPIDPTNPDTYRRAAGIQNAFAALDWLGNPHNWLRIGTILAGAILLILALIRMGAMASGN
jgi:hypothetical protein